jgi:hypothetical protein
VGTDGFEDLTILRKIPSDLDFGPLLQDGWRHRADTHRYLVGRRVADVILIVSPVRLFAGFPLKLCGNDRRLLNPGFYG